MSPVPPRSFHELPLVLFTALAAAGAGIAVTSPAGVLLRARFSPREMGLVATALIASGLLVSFLHLGRKERGWRALARFGRSPLSTEVAFGVITVGTSAAGLQWIAAAAGLSLLVSIGLVYRLPGQSAWRWEAAAAPAILGTAFGFALQFEGAAFVVLLLLGADLVLSGIRWLGLEMEQRRCLPAHHDLFAARRWIALSRIVAVTILPAAGLSFDDTVAAAALVAGIGIDRFAFYALALQRTTEAEVSRINSLLRSSSNS